LDVLKAVVVRRRGEVGKSDGQRTQERRQGGVISPLLSNLYLHWFDKVFYRESGPASWANARLFRYADDFVVLARHQGERLQGGSNRSSKDGWGLRSIGQDAGD